jgi:hypothetical protein
MASGLVNQDMRVHNTNNQYGEEKQQNSYQPDNASSSQFNYIFPPAFGVYRASGTLKNLVIAQSANESKSSPTFFISIHGPFSSQPSVVLHSQGSEDSQMIATASFHSFSQDVDIFMNLPNGQTLTTTLIHDGTFSRTHSFMIPLLSGSTEAFEWKMSSGPEVGSLNGSSHGAKLVRKSNGQVVAAWARPGSGTKKRGKMTWMGDRDPRSELGPTFELATVITRLALVEKEARTRAAGAAAAGAA